MFKTRTINTSCPDCGSKLITIPVNFDFYDDSVDASCADCGRIITRFDVADQATASVKKKIDHMIRGDFKGVKCERVN